jgi:hypothetical protein
MAGVTGTLRPSKAGPLIQIKGTAEGQKERPLLSVGRGLVTAMEDARRGVTHLSSAPWTPESTAREFQYALRLRSALTRPMPLFVFLACLVPSMLRDHCTHAKAQNESDANAVDEQKRLIHVRPFGAG